MIGADVSGKTGEQEPSIPYPGGVKPFPGAKPGVAAPIANSGKQGLTNAEKAVWYTRPVPLNVGTSSLSQISAASDRNSYAYNTWYDKSDVKGNFKLLDPSLQLLYTAVAKSYSKRSTGEALFEDLVDQSGYQSTVGNRVGPHQLVYQIAASRGILGADGTFNASKWLKDFEKDQAGGGGSRYGTTTSTATQRSVSLTDPDTARMVVNTALEAYLGKSASPEQEAEFMKALRQHEKKNARVTTQTAVTTTSPGGSVSNTSSMTKGGSNSQQFAADWAMSQEGSAEFRAATDYMDAFMNALKNSSDVVG